MTYRISNAAKADLKHIYIEGAALFGEAQANAYFKGLFAVFETLAQFPNMARLRTEIKPPIHGHPHKSHIIFYDILDSGDIEIIRIRHGREDWVGEGTHDV